MQRLVLCLDGTWNAADSPDPITNIVVLRDLVDPLWKNGTAIEKQRIYYDEGVGTAGRLDRLIAGATGAGLDDNVRQAYRFLSQFYEPECEIYIFGFSRGAFTARSLAGYIGAAGLLTRQNCSPETETRTWAYYRTPPKERYPSTKEDLSRFTHPDVRITCLGVFDTVGALGIPSDLFESLNRRRYAFHDTKLSSIVDHALHALAVDEKRGPFGTALWAFPDHKNYLSVEQVWFPGVHSNIGGGYEDRRLSDLALRWMLDRIKAKKLGLKLYQDRPEIVGDPTGKLYESRTALYTYSQQVPKIRVINQAIPNQLARMRLSRLPPHANPIGEMLHWSVLDRWKRSPLSTENGGEYRPVNVEAAFETIYSSDQRFQTHVVGRRNEPLNWAESDADYEELRDLLPPEHQKRLQAARSRMPSTPRPVGVAGITRQAQ
ncbi:DUF2235 domain-containing protein [Microvirga subterranea]|uniref:Putative alpha/beta hydrolase family protein DUF2235 n=1 Tax=Microvirga subterranea TaxID=186651 RepID=A0A370HF15_9HYPH|nr:DUF2235 domain-containing protein [Microvirga subterranea]RDI53622.1 putative alpha/beta hydrolase family protein DUF2235 [Microvirga subterranea]